MKLYLVHFSLVIFLISCASNKKTNEKNEIATGPNDKIVQEFGKGSDYLSNEQYYEAAQVFKGILKKYPTSELDIITQYNLGASYEGMGECEYAARVYRATSRTAMNRFPKLQAQALYRLSHAYECLGYDKKVIVSLMDAARRKQFLSEEVARAEIPARLAAAYARNGQRVLADRYYDQASRGIEYLRRRHNNPKKKRDLLAKTLFFMGKVSRPNKIKDTNIASHLGKLRYLQTYLLRSVELQSTPWSKKAAQEIYDAYRWVWTLVDHVGSGVEEANIKDELLINKKKAEVLEEVLISVKQLRAERFPDKNEPNLLKRLFASLGKEEKKYQEYLTKLSVGTPLTSEARSREGIYRKEVMKDKPSVLEKRVKNKKLPPKKKDPNL